MFKKEILFRPAFDKRSDDPEKNYGIGSVDMIFRLIGEHGGVTFNVLTGWHLPGVVREIADKPGTSPQMIEVLTRGMGAAITAHAKKPWYEGQKKMEADCEITGKNYCYCDSGYMAADELFKVFVASGVEPVWTELEVYYWRKVARIYEKEKECTEYDDSSV